MAAAADRARVRAPAPSTTHGAAPLALPPQPPPQREAPKSEFRARPAPTFDSLGGAKWARSASSTALAAGGSARGSSADGGPRRARSLNAPFPPSCPVAPQGGGVRAAQGGDPPRALPPEDGRPPPPARGGAAGPPRGGALHGARAFGPPVYRPNAAPNARVAALLRQGHGERQLARGPTPQQAAGAAPRPPAARRRRSAGAACRRARCR
jgi:hypothetical protein